MGSSDRRRHSDRLRGAHQLNSLSSSTPLQSDTNAGADHFTASCFFCTAALSTLPFDALSAFL